MVSTLIHTQNLEGVLDRAVNATRVQGSARSAAAVVPRILDLFPQAGSVVDVGCGVGTWLHQFRLHGVPRILGIDSGDPAIDLLQVRKTEFLRRDLSLPFKLNEQFDLVVSLGVAERLAPEYADSYVSNLTRLGDVIIFSAAIPGQGGTNHAHERWPSYWVGAFRKEGFVCRDILRGDFWYDERVEWWYAQNMVIFVKESRSDLLAKLDEKLSAHKAPLDLVHPRCFEIYRKFAAENAKSVETRNAVIKVSEEAAALRSRLQAIEQSASWRAISILQHMVDPYPNLRKLIRRAAKLTWWIVTLRLADKIRERRTRARA